MKKNKNNKERTKKVNTDSITIKGCKVLECLPNAMFRVQLPNENIVLCTISGKIRIHNIRILPDDNVDIELGIYDMTKGRIVYRNK